MMSQDLNATCGYPIMSGNDLLSLLRAKPFTSFRIVTSDGTTYEIHHPELVIVSLASAVIGYPDLDNPAIASRYDIVSMRHIVRLEPGLQTSNST